MIPVEAKKYTVSVEYCVPCDYSAHALQVAEEIVRNYQHIIDKFYFIMGSNGSFEVRVGEELIFSKKVLGRHADPGEVLTLFKAFVGSEIAMYPRS